MPVIAAIAGLLFPRIMILVLYFFTAYLNGVWDTRIVPILGFLIMPVSMLWYAVVHHEFAGEWTTAAVIGMVAAVTIDLGIWKKGSRKNKGDK